MVIPSMPAAPLLARTRCHAACRLSRCSTRSNRSLLKAGFESLRWVTPSPVGVREFKCGKAPPLFQMFGPSPCLTHYGEHLTTLASADFCLITRPVTRQSAIGFHRVRSPLVMGPREPRHLYTRASLVIYRSLVKQISPDKSMHCLCTAASFTVAVRSPGFDVLCHLASSLRLI